MVQFTDSFGHLSTGLRGIFIACFLVAAAMGSLVNGAISDRISRKRTICLGALVCCLGSIISATALTAMSQMFVGRIVFGIGTGLAFSCCVNYIVEIAPTQLRGQLSCILQMFVALGAMCGYFFTYATINIESSFAWRVPFFTQCFAALFLAAGIPFMPFSPRWLLSKGKEAEAIEVMRYLRGSSDLVGILAEVREIKKIIASETQNSASYKEIFATGLRKRSLLTMFLMVIQQASGIDAVLYFAPTIFKSAGLISQSSSFLASAMTGLVLVICTIPGFFTDKLGRRNPTLYGGAIMGAAMLTMAICFLIGGSTKADGITLAGKGLQWTVVAMVYVFVAAFEATWAVCLRTYCCEIIPTRQRSRACALQQYVNWVANFVIAISAPSFLKASASGPYFFYGVCCLLGVAVSAVYMKETKGQSLERMGELFGSNDSSTMLVDLNISEGKSSAVQFKSVDISRV